MTLECMLPRSIVSESTAWLEDTRLIAPKFARSGGTIYNLFKLLTVRGVGIL